MPRPRSKCGDWLRTAVPVPSSRLFRWVSTALSFLVLHAGIASAQPGDDPRDPVRLRELYVPYEEFQRLTGENPDGIVLDLEEYRELVHSALERREGPPPPLPPLAAAVLEGRYQGTPVGERVRIEGELTVLVTGDEWARCPLGRALPNLGSITLDDAPGWIVLENGFASLLIRGAGRHTARVIYTLPIGEGDEGATLTGPVVPAAAGTFTMEVPGRATARAVTGVLDVLPFVDEAGDAATRLEVALGGATSIELRWRRERTLEENPLLLTATHRISILARAVDPRFLWESRVHISRRRTETLRFQVPAEMSVVGAGGDLLHTWQPIDGGVEVTLRESTSGEVVLRFDGPMTIVGDRITFTPPRLENASSDRGVVFLFGPPRGTLRVDEQAGVEPLDPSIGTALREFPRRSGAPDVATHAPVGRFVFSRLPARLALQVIEDTPQVTLRQSYLVLEDLERRRAHGVLQWRVPAGRAVELALDVPPEWQVVSLDRADGGPALRWEEVARDGARQIRIVPPRSLDGTHPLVARIVLEPIEFPEAPGPEGRIAQFALPRPVATTGESALLERTDLGIVLSNDLLLARSELDGWRTLPAEELDALAQSPSGNGLGAIGARLVAGVTTASATPTVAFTARRLPAQGEVRSVTHVLAAERTHGPQGTAHAVRIRTDLQVIVLDRAVDVLTIEHPPLGADVAVHVLGDGIREVVADSAGGRQTVRFVRPWTGMRQIRVELEVPAIPGTPIAFPEIGLGGDFGGARFLAVQSQGSVEVEIAPGTGLARIELDDLPDFAEPWLEGRLLEAFRHRRLGGAGTFTTILHARAPVLTQLARELVINTVLGRDGTSRTESEILLSSAREQTLRIDLPADARCLAVTIDGEPIRHVRTDEGGVPAGFRRIAIPLPPRSHARLSITTERPRDGRARALDGYGTWREQGPRLVGVPVGETRWTIHHPEGIRVFAGEGGNLLPADPRSEERVQYFANSFFGALLHGRLPRFSIFEAARAARPYVSAPALTPAEAEGALVEEAAASGAGRSLAPRKAGDEIAGVGKAPAVRPPLLAAGRRVILSKYGGSPRAELRYRDILGSQGRVRFIFGAALIACFILDRLRRSRELWLLIGVGLFVGTFLPPAFGWESPFLWIPLCEGLVVALALGGIRLLVRAAAAGLASRRQRRLAFLEGAVAGAILLVATIAGPGTVTAQEGEPTRAIELPALPTPFDTVLIPYGPDGPPWASGAESPKVYISEKRFRELWRLAHPDEIPLPEVADTPVPYAVGAGSYTLELEGDRYRLRGTMPVQVLEPEKWVTLSLPVGGARLERATVDGAPAGTTPIAGAHQLLLRGRRIHQLELEWVGEISRNLGVYSIGTPIVAAAAARVTGVLPTGAEIDAARSSPGLALDPDTEDHFAIDVGPTGSFALTWSFPRIEGDLSAQVSSVSYTELRAVDDRLDLVRIELVGASGRPVERARYRIEGGWEVVAIDGTQVSEWSVLTENGRSFLEVSFRVPVEAVRFRILGFADARTTVLPTLTLEGAVRQETFVGLSHGEGWRFSPDALSDLARASITEAGEAVRIDGIRADRVHHGHGSAAGSSLSLVPAPSRANLETEAVARIAADRLQVFVRTRFTQVERGPLRLRVALPDGWTVPNVETAKLRRFEVVPAGTGRELILDLGARAAVGDAIVWSAELEFTGETPTALSLPALRTLADAGTRLEETVTWTIASEEGIDLASAGGSTWEAVPVERAAPWMSLAPRDRTRFAFRTVRAEAPLAITVHPRASRLRATVVSFAHLGEEELTVHSRIVPEVRFSGRDTFVLRIPPGAELVDLTVRDERSRVVRRGDAGTEVVIQLLSPVTGIVEIDLLHRIPRGSEGDDATPIVLAPVVVIDGGQPLEETEVYVGVVQPERSLTLALTPTGLTPIERERVPFLPAGVRAESIRATFTAGAVDWKLTLAEEEIEVAEGLAAVIPLVDITTRLGRDGTMRSEAAITLLNERLQFLTVDLPLGATLWGVTVDGIPVAVASEPGATGRANPARLRIPVDPAVGSQLAREIVLTYAERDVDLPSLRAHAELEAPTVVNDAVQVVETIWTVRFPEGYAVTESGGRMQQAPPSARHAERLRQLMEQQATVLDASQGMQSRRGRERAAQQLAKIEQQLGDSLAGLSELNRSAGEMSQLGIFGEKNLEQQWRDNDQVIQRTQQAQQQIRQALEAEAGREAGAAPDEEAFQDRAQFLHGKGWRGGSRADSPAAGGEEPQQTGTGPGAESLLSPHPYPGWRALSPLPATSAAEAAKPRPIDPSGGLTPLPDTARLRAAAGFPPATPEAGAVTYTFRRSDADASLNLRLTKDGATLQLLSWVMLLVAAAWVVWRQRSLQHPTGMG